MTRFQRELSGQLGAFWQKHAEEQLAHVKADLDCGEITIDEAGVARNCIGRVLMDDLLEMVEMVTDKANRQSTGRPGGPPVGSGWPKCGPSLARGPRWWMSSPARQSSFNR